METIYRIEPTLLESPTSQIADVLTELSGHAAVLGQSLHPRTAQQLASLVRMMNSYYSNLIEGHDTLPREIERALSGDFDVDQQRRNLQVEATAHIRVQEHVDDMVIAGTLPNPSSIDFLLNLHEEFYRDAADEMLLIGKGDRRFRMKPGHFRSEPGHDNQVGNHVPPSSEVVMNFMRRFEERYDFSKLGASGKIMAIPAAHHRFNYIHPFSDGNGRVSRLMSHAMFQVSGIGAHGLWSISRGLARGLESRQEYKMMMDHADAARQGDRDGRGNLSEAALTSFVLWFLRISLDQVTYMSSLFDLQNLTGRLKLYVERSGKLRSEAFHLLQEASIRGEFARGEAARITGLPESSARIVLADTIKTGLLASNTPKGPVSLRFPVASLDLLFPQLFPST